MRVSDRRRQQQQPDSRRRQNDRFFPNVSAVFVREVVRFVEHDQIGADFIATAQRVEKLVAIDLGGADDQRRVRVFFSVASQYSDFVRAEFVAELLVFGVCECLQGRRVPGATPALQKPTNLLARDPGFAAAGGRRDQHVFILQQRQRLELKGIGLEWRRARGADSFEQPFDFARLRRNNAR